MLEVSSSGFSNALSFCESPGIKIAITERMIMIENAAKSVLTVSYSARELVKEIRSSFKEKSFLKSFHMSISSLQSCKNRRICVHTMVWQSLDS